MVTSPEEVGSPDTGVVVQVALIGHSGATAVWEGRVPGPPTVGDHGGFLLSGWATPHRLRTPRGRRTR
jgi:hypothetical protein